MNQRIKHSLQSIVSNMPHRLQHVIAHPLKLYAHHDQQKRLNASAKQVLSIIQSHSDASRPRIFVDCGFNNGTTLQKFIDILPQDFVFYGFEIQDSLKNKAEKLLENNLGRSITLEFAAVSNSTENITYYPSKDVIWGGLFDRIGTTAFKGLNYPGHLDYKEQRIAPAVDFSNWLSAVYNHHVSAEGKHPFIAVKMNIEGAEYPALSKVLTDKNMDKIGMLAAEFHWDKFLEPERSKLQLQHNQIIQALNEQNIPYMDWR